MCGVKQILRRMSKGERRKIEKDEKEAFAERRGEQTQLPLVVQTIQLIPDPPLPGINLLICQDHTASGHTCSTRQLALNKAEEIVSAFATVQSSCFAPKVLAEDSLGSPRDSRSLMSHQEVCPETAHFLER